MLPLHRQDTEPETDRMDLQGARCQVQLSGVALQRYHQFTVFHLKSARTSRRRPGRGSFLPVQTESFWEKGDLSLSFRLKRDSVLSSSSLHRPREKTDSDSRKQTKTNKLP